MFFGRLPERTSRFIARSQIYLLNHKIMAAGWLSRHNTSFLVVLTIGLMASSILLTPALQTYLEPHFLSVPERLSAFRSLLVGVGASLIGATAIILSVVMLAVQLNFARIPFGLFRKLSSDIPLLASFAATFLFGVSIGACSLLPDETWVAPAAVLSGWCVLAALALFFIAYKRALDLISPAKQLQIVGRKAQRSMRLWRKRADRFAPLLESKPAAGSNRDIARASFFRLHPHWESEVREASSHVLAFARRYAEQGEYDVSALALNGLVAINREYIFARGNTFFPSNPFFTNPLSAEAFISDTLEKLRRLAMSGQGRSDEEQFIQVMNAFADLCATYAFIDYGKEFAGELQHSQLAASYLAGVMQDAPRTFGPDVLMEGARLLGRSALVLIHAGHASGAITVAQNISSIAPLGLVKSGYEPVTSTAVQQLASLAFSMLSSKEHDIGYPLKQVRSRIHAVANAVLQTVDRRPLSQHSAHLKAYYSLADYQTFADNLTRLVSVVCKLPPENDDAKRIISHLSDWSDGIYKGEKQLLLAAVENRSFLALDLIHWICHVTETLADASAAPAASDYYQRELSRNAVWLVSVLDWIQDDAEIVSFVENFQIVEQLFNLTLKMHMDRRDEIADATRSILLRWSLKAGKHRSGWASLERSLTALCVLAASGEDLDWLTWLKTEFATHLERATIEQDILQRAAHALQQVSENPSHHRSLDSVGYHLNRADQNRLSEGLEAIAELLGKKAAAASQQSQ